MCVREREGEGEGERERESERGGRGREGMTTGISDVGEQNTAVCLCMENNEVDSPGACVPFPTSLGC